MPSAERSKPMLENILIILIVGGLVGLAAGYIYKAKKSGKKCIGCPDGDSCSGNCGQCGGCNSGDR